MKKKSIWDLVKLSDPKKPEVKIELSSDQLVEVNEAHQTKVSELEAQIATLTTERDEARTERDEHHANLQVREDELTKKKARISELEKEVKALGEKPAAKGSEAKGGDQSGQEDDESRWLTPADKAARAAHERKLKRQGKKD